MTNENTPMEQINVKVPKQTKEVAKQKLEHGGITRVVRERLNRVAHGGNVNDFERVRDNLTKLRDERRELLSQRENIESQLEQLERKIERAERELEQLEDKKGEYEGMLKTIEEIMRENGITIDPGNGHVKTAAEAGNCEPIDVVKDLEERNQDINNDRFKHTEQ